MPVRSMIEGAVFALVRPRDVVLVAKTTDTCLHGVVLASEQGLHYDGDATIGKDYAQEKIEEGEWELTRNWTECEHALK